MSRVQKFVSNDLTLRIAAVDATEAVREMQFIQNAMPLASVGVGRSMVAALLMASNLKEGQRVGLLLKGNGPLASIFAEANYEGQVRGYCACADYQAPNEKDILNLGKALGNGTLSVTRHQPFQRQPFHGTVEMVSGEVGDDVAQYLAQSQQIRSVVSLGVYLDSYGKVQAAGGVLIEVMPGVEEEVVSKVEANALKYKVNISKQLHEGVDLRKIIDPYLEGIPYTQIPHDHEIQYFCPCTSDRVTGALTILGEDELQDMIDEKKDADITCQICGRNYVVTIEDLVKIKESVRKNALH